jgi:deoxyhypusine synthase
MPKSKSLLKDAPDILPVFLEKGLKVSDFVDKIGNTCFEARNLLKGARLYQKMIEDGDTIWLAVAGAGVSGGLGGIIISLIEAGFIDLICSTGAQVYHDLHFAFDLPVKAMSPKVDDAKLRKYGDTRIYDIGIREKETLQAQDLIIQKFIKEQYKNLSKKPLSSSDFNYLLGKWAEKNAPRPNLSFVIAASRYKVPIFWDSFTNHSIALNTLKTTLEGFSIEFSEKDDLLLPAAINYDSKQVGFIELGGGGPKNFIQQTGPILNQILGIEYEGADRGLQISTANEREGSLSSCSFGEGITWGKYKGDQHDNLVQIWGEYSIIFPILAAYVVDRCQKREPRKLMDELYKCRDKLLEKLWLKG